MDAAPLTNNLIKPIRSLDLLSWILDSGAFVLWFWWLTYIPCLLFTSSPLVFTAEGYNFTYYILTTFLFLVRAWKCALFVFVFSQPVLFIASECLPGLPSSPLASLWSGLISLPWQTQWLLSQCPFFLETEGSWGKLNFSGLSAWPKRLWCIYREVCEVNTHSFSWGVVSPLLILLCFSL